MTRFAVGLGSNIGDRLATLRSALEDIAELGSDLEVSSLYESAPVGGPEQGPYLNAAVAFQTDLRPLELLRRLQAIEIAHGRVRRERWGPRTLDLDIIASDDGTGVETPDLVVPHPRAGERLFVALPMMDIWAEAQISPGISVGEAVFDLESQDVDRIATRWVKGFGNKGRWLVTIQLVFFAAIGILVVADGSWPAWPGWASISGAIIVIAGLTLTWLSARALGANLVAVPEPRRGGSLVNSGPYRVMRHPIYLAVSLMLIGVSIAAGSTLALLLTLALYGFLVYKSRYEEGLLRSIYPAYWSYMQKVRWGLPPFRF